MSCISIRIEQGRKVCHQVRTEAEYKALRDSSTNQRWLSEYVEGKEEAKRKLQQFNYSCLPEEGGLLKGCKAMSDTVGMDIDLHRQDGETMESFRARFDELVSDVYTRKAEAEVLMMEYSVSAYAKESQKLGMHLVFRRQGGMSQEENLKWAAERLGVEYDAGAKDITRVFFTTTSNGLIYLDPELFMAREVNEVSEGLRADEKTLAEGKEGKEVLKEDIINESNKELKKESEKRNSIPLNSTLREDYRGIPYSRIIQKWWDIHYDGREPVEGDRNTKLFELAVNLRNICGFDEALMMKVIPRYGDFPEAELRQTIKNAISEKHTQMPKRLRDVLNAIKVEMLRGSASTDEAFQNTFRALEESELEDDLFIYNRVPKPVLQVKGIGDSIQAMGNTMVMPALVADCTCIGARATSVRLNVHGTYNSLNIIGFIVGDAASNKGLTDDVVKAWMVEDQQDADAYNAQRREWARKKKASLNKKDQPEQPENPKVMIPLNNTPANVAEEISFLEGKHAFSFSSEADCMTAKWKGQNGLEFSTMLRTAFDAARYDREAKNVDATNVHIEHLRWNVLLAGTPDALYRAIDNVTDGFLSRVSISRTPDNTYKALEDNPPVMTDKARTNIENVSSLLPLMRGEIDLPKLESKGREWLESVRRESMKNGDDTMARQRFRIAVTAQRMVCCLMLASVASKLIDKHGVEGAKRQLKSSNDLWKEKMLKAQTPAMLEMYDVIADSLMDSVLYYFRSRIEKAVKSENYKGVATIGTSRVRKGKNDSIYSMLKEEFCFEEAMRVAVQVKGINATYETVRQMLKNWAQKGLIEQTDVKLYRKVVVN